MRVLQQKGITQWCIIQSFDVRPLQYLHARYPAVHTSLLVEETDKRPFEAIISGLGFTPSIYSPYFKLVTGRLVKECHQKHMRLVPWTVNDVADMKRLKAMGVDGLISDYPDRYKDL